MIPLSNFNLHISYMHLEWDESVGLFLHSILQLKSKCKWTLWRLFFHLEILHDFTPLSLRDNMNSKDPPLQQMKKIFKMAASQNNASDIGSL